METYRYTGFDETGKKVSGTEDALSAGAAHIALLDRGYQSVSITEKKKSLLQFEITKKTVPRKHIMHFSRQLSVFVRAGIPIMEALEVIAEETPDKLMHRTLFDMIERLQSGDTFASAAAAHPEAFPNYYVGILSSAELTGNLDVVLDQLADYLERDIDARSKITSAMVYPAVVACMAVVVVVVLATFVMPKFVVFFKSFNAQLPLPTRMLLGVSNFFSHYWWLMLAALVVVAVAGVATRRSVSGKAWIDSMILKLPILGDLVRTAIIERICRILSSMIRAGVALPDAMRVTSESSNNAVYRRGLSHVREEMMEGQGLAEPLSRTGLFPGAARQMFRVGEETGTLDAQLATAAAFYDRELDVKLKRFTSLFEPAVIIFMGVIVGFVAVALVSAMYGIYHQVKVQ
jgi:type IV pilus assembly protein PilC